MIPSTSTTLLRQIGGDLHHARWAEFVARYRPMMEAFMRERFPTVEADDVIQETLIALCKVLPNYSYAPDEKGHFRNYLTGILRNKASAALRKQRQQADLVDEIRRDEVIAPDGRAVAPRPPEGADGRARSPSAPDDIVDEQTYREAIFEIALRQFLAYGTVADRTKRIFERVAINGESPETVAASFKMKRHAVDQAKSRAMSRLREIVKQLENVVER